MNFNSAITFLLFLGNIYNCAAEDDTYSHLSFRHMNLALNKPTYQSSTGQPEANHHSGNAVDGKTLSCSKTGAQPYNYFEIDLQEPMSFVEITINNDYLQGFTNQNMTISGTDVANNKSVGEQHEFCYSSLNDIPEANTITCHKILHKRYIVFQQWGPTFTDSIQLCEVQVHPVRPTLDIAYNQPTYQSSIEPSENDDDKDNELTHFAVDGNRDTCSCSLSEEKNLFQIDLPATYAVVEIIVVNTYKFPYYIRDFTVKGKASQNAEPELCSVYTGHLLTGRNRIKCDKPLYVKYVIIEQTVSDYTTTKLCLCEVYVMTAGLFNAAFKKPFRQSTVDYMSWGSLARDGALHHGGLLSCSKTQYSLDNFWEVDLDGYYNVTTVAVSAPLCTTCSGANPPDDFSILVTSNKYEFVPSVPTNWPVCIHYKSALKQGLTKWFPCEQKLFGRFVSIVQKSEVTDKALILCEVQVLADCANGRYGQGCGHDCPNQCPTTCDKVDGECPTCGPGMTGTSCDEVCKPGKYGSHCKYQCSGNCLNGQPCDTVTGFCEGCAPGYRGSKCEASCTTGKYGRNCASKCPEECPNTCDPVYGTCSNWKDLLVLRCPIECPNNCNEMGSCLSSAPPANNAQGPGAKSDTNGNSNTVAIIVPVVVIVIVVAVAVGGILCCKKKEAEAEAEAEAQQASEQRVEPVAAPEEPTTAEGGDTEEA